MNPKMEKLMDRRKSGRLQEIWLTGWHQAVVHIPNCKPHEIADQLVEEFTERFDFENQDLIGMKHDVPNRCSCPVCMRS